VRILLDENIPESVRRALEPLGHEVDSVVSLRFILAIAAVRPTHGAVVKAVRVTLPQAPGAAFATAFIDAFQITDWSTYPNGGDWPPTPSDQPPLQLPV
jgi:hypothetical protein